MELRRTAELALRSSSSSGFTSCLYRSTRRNGATRTFLRCHRLERPISQTSCRQISTSAPTSQQAAATKKEEEHVDDRAQAQQQQQKSPQGTPSTQRTSSADYRDLIEGRLDFVPAASSQSKPDKRIALDTISVMRNGLAANRDRRSRSSSSPFDFSRMSMPNSSFDPTRPFPAVRSAKPIEVATQAPPFEIGPRLGRTVDVDETRNVDLARAFRLLEIKCATNRVKQDFNAQRFHERPGLKRKRLKSQRWRKRFKADFQATIRRVQNLHRQGW